METIVLTINGEDVAVAVEPKWTLLHVLRHVLRLTQNREKIRGTRLAPCPPCVNLLIHPHAAHVG